MGIQLQQAEFANEAFYLAFEAKDFTAMSHLWSSQREVVCLHPGWQALVGREEVLNSWQAILANPQESQVSFYGASTIQLGADSAMVICYEKAGSQTMIASNIFVEEDDRLCLVSHHAGYCARPPVDNEN